MRLAIALLLLAGAASAQDEEGRALFDGRSLAGWDGDPRFWSVEDGAIVGRSTEAVPLERTTYLVCTAVEPADFELSFSFRIDGGNSGAQFRSRVVGEWQVAGYQGDIEDGSSWTGCLYEQDGRGVVARRGERIEYAADGARSASRFAEDAALLARFRRGAWNEYRVVARGPRVELFVNGARTVELVDRDATRAARRGVIAFQLHTGPPMEVHLRDVRLRELPAGEDPEPPPTASAPPPPQWIWSSASAADGETAAFQHGFELRGGLERATWSASGDNHVELRINGGETLGAGSEWTRPFAVDVTDALVEGINRLALWGRNDGGPGALVAWLELEFEDGARQTIVTDASWLATDAVPDDWAAAPADPAAWRPATVLAPLGGGPWGALPEPTRGRPDAALPASEIELPPGFRAQLLYSVPRASQGSWVSLCEDPQGRFYASDQSRGLYRVTVDPRAAGVRSVERVEVDLAGAQGLLWAFDALYAVVNAPGGASGLHRLRDTDGDDRLDQVERLRALDGWGEHGPHAVRLAPDGASLYVLAGNHTRLPEGVRERPWGEDQLLPRLNDPGGHAVGVMAPGGWLCRTDPDGKQWELVCWGMRNAYDFDFSTAGEVFTYDSDMEWDVGLPWYRPTRILHLVPEGEFGWRHGSGKWPESYPDSLPAAVDVGLGSPTGVEFGTRASFPERWRDALYALDWAYGTIHAVHLEQTGEATWTGSSEVFLSGKPLPVTDVVVARDGALYFTTGGRGTQSGLYRVTWGGAEIVDAAPEPSVRDARRQDLEARIQRYLEAQRDLDDPDRFVRFALRTRLEGRPVAEWQEEFALEGRPRAAVEMSIALARVGQPGHRALVVAKVCSLPLEQLDDETLLGVLRALGLAFVRLGAPDDAQREQVLARLDPLFPSGRKDLDRELARLLIRLDAPDLVPRALRAMREAGTQEDGLHYAFLLRWAEGDWTLGERRAYFAWLDDVAATYRGGASFAKYLRDLRAAVRTRLSDDERAALDVELVRPTVPSEGPTLDLSGRPTTSWSVEELSRDAPLLRRGRSFETGRAAFVATTCQTCHRIAGEGGSTGPDLTGAGARFSPRDLLEAILEPSSVVSDQYRDSEVRTLEGELIVGRVLADDGRRLVLLGPPPAEERLEIDRATVDSIRPHALSRMPEGLVQQLTRQELLDLLAYVLAGGDPADPAFGL